MKRSVNPIVPPPPRVMKAIVSKRDAQMEKNIGSAVRAATGSE
jgi:hypothetical protein